MEIKSNWLATALYFCLACAGAGERVTVPQGSHPTAPVASSIVYKAECKDGPYSLEFNTQRKQVNFRPAGESSTPVDLTKSSLGQVFFGNKLYGKAAVACGQPGMAFLFVGFNIVANEAKPVSYYVLIDREGGVLGDDVGLREESQDYVLRKKMD